MKNAKNFCLMTLTGLTVLFSLVLMGCGGEQGIREPLNLPPPSPSVTPPQNGQYAVIRGNYFLLDTDCPHDSTALRVAQEQDGLLMNGGFTFDDPDAFLVGFVDENAVARFFGSDDAANANCTAQVEDDTMLGSCTYESGIEVKECRFVFTKAIAGTYSKIWNDCESNDADLVITQSNTDVTMTDGFDFNKNKDPDIYLGVIQEGMVLFNVQESFNCDYIVTGTELQGRCRDLKIDPSTTVCTFGYEDASRLDGVDLNNDALFPSPAVTPGINPTVYTDLSGTYALVSNDCADDGGTIQIAQDGPTLGFLGGFDYQTVAPDLYAGSLTSNVDFAFSVLGPTEEAYCAASVILGQQGIAGFNGTCTVQPSQSTCDFSYSKLP